MTTHRYLPLLAALLVGGLSAAQAQGWTRHATFIGPRGGTSTYNGGGSCANGACSSQGTFTGPRGQVYTRQGATSCANGVCTTNGSVSGPNGQIFQRSGSFSRYPN